jgi:polyisoprenoid-binding protein YceI
MITKLTPTQAPAAGSYVLDPKRTSVTFRTRHMFGLAPVKGRFQLGAATMTVAEPLENSTVEASLPSASFSTRNPLRDIPVHSRLFLDAKRHPTISFRSDTVSGKNGAWHVTGELVVKGHAAPVDLTIDTVTTSGPSITLHATGEVDRHAHGVTAMKGMAARRLSFEITAAGKRL